MRGQIRKDPKIVTAIPVQELWAGQRLISTIRLHELTASDIEVLLRLQPIRFVVAELGKELLWIANNERFDFWMHEGRSQVTTLENKDNVAKAPSGCAYIASEWQPYKGEPIVLLEKY